MDQTGLIYLLLFLSVFIPIALTIWMIRLAMTAKTEKLDLYKIVMNFFKYSTLILILVCAGLTLYLYNDNKEILFYSSLSCMIILMVIFVGFIFFTEKRK